MEIEKRIEIALLTKYYGAMLTDKQREIIDMYVDNNLSLAEVSEELNISRQAVKFSLDSAFNSLENFENKLHFIARDKKLKDYVTNSPVSEISLISKIEINKMIDED